VRLPCTREGCGLAAFRPPALLRGSRPQEDFGKLSEREVSDIGRRAQDGIDRPLMRDTSLMSDGLRIDEIARLGVFDSDDPDAADIIEYLEWLAADGHDVIGLARLTQLEHFGAVTSAASMRPGAMPLADHDGVTLDPQRLVEIARAFGFDREIIATGAYTPAEVRVLHAVDAGAALFSGAETLYFAQVVGSALARIADAAVSLFMFDFELPLQDENLSRTDMAIRSKEATGNLQVVIDALDPLFRVHMAQAMLRNHHAAGKSATTHGVRQAVGFVDLVGFTTLSASLSMADLSELVREFEARARDVVSDCGARVVKIIGDAVMISAVEPDPVVRAASALLAEFGVTVHVEARGGLTYGDVLARGGDYYGPVVNLAARLGDLAVPGELLATTEFVDALHGDLHFEPAGRRQLKGFAEPVPTVSLMS
jgi:adenylate cyclase